MKNFAEVARPLYHLMEKSKAFRWTKECQEAFTELKERLTSALIFVFPGFSQSLDTNVSDSGTGAVLSQSDNDGTERVIAYISCN